MLSEKRKFFLVIEIRPLKKVGNNVHHVLCLRMTNYDGIACKFCTSALSCSSRSSRPLSIFPLSSLLYCYIYLSFTFSHYFFPMPFCLHLLLIFSTPKPTTMAEITYVTHTGQFGFQLPSGVTPALAYNWFAQWAKSAQHWVSNGN